MLKDTQNEPTTPNKDDPIQEHYNRQFAGIVGNMDKETPHPLGEAEIAAAEKSSEGPAKVKESGDEAPERSLYNSTDQGTSFKQRLANKYSKKTVAIGASSSIMAIVVLIAATFGLLNSFKLDHIMNNIERKGFIRYQVSMDNRSSKWIEAYIRLRLMEIDGGKNTNPLDDNILFRSNRVDNNNPLTDWYKTMRSSKFEADLAEKNGIKFTSVAKKGPNGTIIFRPGVVSINDKPITFSDTLTKSEIKSIENVDVNGLNGRLRDFVDVDVFDNDIAARRAIKNAVNDNTHAWQVLKRRTIRKNIQNMTGVRDWRFFEKTRDKVSEKKINIRNKLIVAALPESTKSGKIVRCLFGIERCKSSTDPIDSTNRTTDAVPDGKKAGSKTGTDADGNVIDADPSQGQDATDITKREYDVDVPEGLQKFFASEIIKKANVATSIISILDSVARINQSISDGSLITMVNMAKAAQAIGVFQVMTTARDQSKTGELTADEYGEFMKIINNATNNEGWQTVIEDSPTGSVRAETNGVFTAAKDKEEYCSEEHQAELHDPANAKAAESEHHYHCDDKKIGSATGAENITKWWNVFFKPFQPLLDAYMAIPLSNLVGFVNNIADSVTGPIISTAIKVVGLESTKDAILGYMTTRITSALGAGPMLDTFTPGGQIMNVMIEGSAASAESSARYQGGVATTALTMDYTNSLIAEYNNEKKYDSNIQKYLALSDPDSVLSKTLFNQVKDINTSDRANSVSQQIALVVLTPLKLFDGARSKAATNSGYAAANFGGVKTYDIPQVCMDLDIQKMIPTDATNADDLGVLSATDITWELLNNNTDFMDKVYEALGDRKDAQDVADTIYNCGAFDTAVRGGMGYMYGYTDDNGYEDGTIKEKSDGSEFTACEADNNEDIYWPTSPHPSRNSHDIGVPEGTKVYAITGGKVTVSKDLKGCDGRACNDGMYSYGRHIKIDHDKLGTVTYAHLKERKVKVGDKVAPGQLIGISGKSGNTYGNPPDHLHIDVDGNETLIPWLQNHDAKKPPNPQCTAYSQPAVTEKRVLAYFVKMRNG